MAAAASHSCGPSPAAAAQAQRRGPLIRRSALIVLTALASPIGTHAQEATTDAAVDRYRDLTSVAPRRNCGAGSGGDEIVVCGRRRDNLRYRLPPSDPAPGTRAEQNVGGERFALQQYRSEGGNGSCSTVGPNGAAGCLALKFREANERSAGREPGLISRALTYLDPDE